MTGETEQRPVPQPGPSPVPAGSEDDELLLAGRYRLVEQAGSDAAVGAQFWRATDMALRRDVAITVLRGQAGAAEAERAARTISQAMRCAPFEHPGRARLLDAVPADGGVSPGGVGRDTFGFAVAEWVPGRTLAELVGSTGIRPLAAVRAALPLAEAAEQAHGQGIVLGCNHPQRIRITHDGRAKLAFPLPRPETTPGDDIRGLGATLYVLLTGRWPLSSADAALAGLGSVERNADGEVYGPGALHPGIPHELTGVITRALGASSSASRIHTAAAVRQVLAELAETLDQTPLLPPLDDGVPAGADDVWREDNGGPRVVDPERRRKLRTGLVGLALALLLVLGFVGARLGLLFGDDGRPSIVVGGPSAEAAVGPAEVVAVAGVKVFDNTGDRDNSGRVSRVIDGNEDSSWRTFTYRQQLPKLKPGVGLMVSFASPVRLTGLTISSPSEGTKIEVRTAPAGHTQLDKTTPLATTTLAKGRTEVALPEGQPVAHLLLWIVELGGGDGEFVTEISEISFRRTAG